MILLTKSEAAALARFSERNLHRWIVAGTCPCLTRIGGRVLVRQDDMNPWIEGQRDAEAPADASGGSELHQAA